MTSRVKDPIRSVPLAVTAIGTLSFGLISGAVAQQAADGQAGELEEVIVTATKQSESIMSVPESITALPATTLTQLNVQSFNDYAGLVPNLVFSYGAPGGQASFTNSRGVTIRGIAGVNTTSMYVDDTPIPISQDPRILDIQRMRCSRGRRERCTAPHRSAARSASSPTSRR